MLQGVKSFVVAHPVASAIGAAAGLAGGGYLAFRGDGEQQQPDVPPYEPVGNRPKYTDERPKFGTVDGTMWWPKRAPLPTDFAEVLEGNLSFAVVDVGGERTVRAMTPGARIALRDHPGIRDAVLGVAEVAEQTGAPFKSVTFARSREEYLADLNASGLRAAPKYRTEAGVDIMRRYRSTENVGQAEVGAGHIVLSSGITKLLLEDAGVGVERPAFGIHADITAAAVVRHELLHLAQTFEYDRSIATSTLRESSADVLAFWPGQLDDARDALDLEFEIGARQAGTANQNHPYYYGDLWLLEHLSLAGVDVSSAGAYEEARALLMQPPERVITELSERIAARTGAPADVVAEQIAFGPIEALEGTGVSSRDIDAARVAALSRTASAASVTPDSWAPKLERD